MTEYLKLNFKVESSTGVINDLSLKGWILKMGKVFSRFWVTETPWQKLDRLESQIKSMEQDSHDTLNMYRNIKICIVLVLLILYGICIIFYFRFYRDSNDLHWLYMVFLPAILLIGVMTILHSIAAWCCRRCLNQKRFKLIQLKTAKKNILEHVRNTEKYMVAKPILDRFENEESALLEPNSWRELP